MWPDFSLIQRPDDEMDGIEGYTAFSPPMIALPDTGYFDLIAGKPRARWTAAHELGHLFLHEATTKHRDTASVANQIIGHAYNSAEWQANRFASEFLMPEHVVSEFTSAEEIARNCQVSLQAARFRLDEIRPEGKKKLPDVVKKYLDEHKG
jgi:Zn-dependent peptidase ImmA (M78 family)